MSKKDTATANGYQLSTRLTKREYFAGLYMQALAQSKSGLHKSDIEDSVKAADVLLQELERDVEYTW